MRHPPPLNDLTPLDVKRYVLGAAVVAVLITGFIVVPIGSPSGAFSASASPTVPGSAGAGMLATTTLTVVNHDLVPHGYVIQGTITAVTAAVNGTAEPLGGAALAAFLANSTWQIDLPNHNDSVFPGSGTFAVPPGDYSALNGSANGTFTVVYRNSETAVVTASLTIGELCSDGAPSTESYSVTMS
jgi:hypothetical protein